MTSCPKIVILSGGVGGSTFVVGMRDAVQRAYGDAALPRVSVVMNTGDDLWLSGLRLQPDVDSVLYALAGVKDFDRGWGRAGESTVVASELAEWGAGWPWFTLGDLDLSAHIARTGWLRDGFTPSQVVQFLAARWDLGVTLLPATDAEIDTRVVVNVDGATEVLHFQEWWTRHRASLPVVRFENPGIDVAKAAPGTVEAILDADLVVIAPSNPVVSIGPILGVAPIREAVRNTTGRVVGVSPIIGGKVVRGMADVCLDAIGVETDAGAVAALYGARGAGGILDDFFLDVNDRFAGGEGLRAHHRSVWMRTTAEAAELAGAVISLAH